MQLTLKSLTFQVASGAVGILVQSAMGGKFYINTTEVALEARVAVPGSQYGNAEALAEAQYLVGSVERFTATTRMTAAEYPSEGFEVVLDTVLSG